MGFINQVTSLGGTTLYIHLYAFDSWVTFQAPDVSNSEQLIGGWFLPWKMMELDWIIIPTIGEN